MKRVLLVSGAMLLLSGVASAATYCVSPTKVSCDPSIQLAIDKAIVLGDVVVIKSGLYPNEGLVNMTAGTTIKGTAGAAIDAGVDAAGEEATTIAVTVDANDITIIGLNIFNGRDTIKIANAVTGTIIKNSTFLGIEGDAISSATTGNDNTQILKNIIFGANDSAIAITGNDVAVISNKIAGILGDAIIVDGFGTEVISNKILDGGGNGIELLNADDSNIERNKLSRAGGIVVDTFTNTTIIKNVLKNGDIKTVSSTGIVDISLNRIDDGKLDVDSGTPVIVKNRIKDGKEIDIICDLNCSAASVTQNTIKNGSGGLVVENIGGVGDSINVTLNRVDHVQEIGLEILGDESVVATSNKIRFAQNCIETGGTGTHSVISNRVSTCAGDGVNVVSPDLTIDGNNVSNVASNGINLEDPAGPVSIVNNKFNKIAKYVLRIASGVTGTDVGDNVGKNFIRKPICDAGTTTTIDPVAFDLVEDVFVPAAAGDCPAI